VWAGFWVEAVVPSPNVQYHEVGELVDVSVNVTVFPLTEYRKLATGAVEARETVAEAVELPPLLEALSVTV
jgi:hypothetical protein